MLPVTDLRPLHRVSTEFGLLALALVAALSWAPTASAGTRDCSSMGEAGPGNVTYQFPVEVRLPGESAFSAVDSDVSCATGTLRTSDGAVGYHFYPGNPGWFADGTVYRFTGSVSGFQAAQAAGGVAGLRLYTDGDQFTIEGRPITSAYVLDPSGNCVASSNPQTYLGGHMDSVARVGDSPLRGATSGSNGTSWTLPTQGENGTLILRVTGCGDADPATREGFVDSYIPPAALNLIGVTPEQVDAADDEGLRALFSILDNGSLAEDVTFTKEAYQDGRTGVRIVYRLSFSSGETVGEPTPTGRTSAASRKPSSHEVSIGKHGSLKPAMPGKPVVRWQPSKRRKTVTATVTVADGSATSYSISASKAGSSASRKGTCKPPGSRKNVTCTIRLARGSWNVTVTPRLGSVAGVPNGKRFRF